jgi:hypothetical protein
MFMRSRHHVAAVDVERRAGDVLDVRAALEAKLSI